MVDISNTDDMHSCVTSRKQNISVQVISTPPRLTPLITTLPPLPVELPKATHLPPFGKEYLCFQVDKKSPHSAQCVKSRVLNKVIDSILSFNTFEQQCVVIKFMLQSSRLEDHMKTIGIDQSSFTRSYFEHICMNNIKKNIFNIHQNILVLIFRFFDFFHRRIKTFHIFRFLSILLT